jgi:hypothetical protein
MLPARGLTRQVADGGRIEAVDGSGDLTDDLPRFHIPLAASTKIEGDTVEVASNEDEAAGLSPGTQDSRDAEGQLLLGELMQQAHLALGALIEAVLGVRPGPKHSVGAG